MGRLIIVLILGLTSITISSAQKRSTVSVSCHKVELVNAVSLETGKIILEKPVEKSELGSALFLSGFVGKYSILSKKTRFLKRVNKNEVFEIK